MIVFDLECRACESLRADLKFEGWFGSSEDFAQQQARGLVTCPVCGSDDVGKALMAPNLGRKGNQMPAVQPTKVEQTAPGMTGPAITGPAMPGPAMTAPALPPEAVQMLRVVAAMQAEALKTSTWVGKSFAEDARAMHFGEKDEVQIHGQATPQEARELIEEGIPVAPILIPIVPPGEAN